MKVLDTFIKSDSPPTLSRRVLWVDTKTNELKYKEGDEWKVVKTIDSSCDNTNQNPDTDQNPDIDQSPVIDYTQKYIGTYKQTNTNSTLYPGSYPETELKLYISEPDDYTDWLVVPKEFPCYATTYLFGGAVSFDKLVPLYYNKEYDCLCFEASLDSPLMHNENGPIISNVYFKFESKNNISLIAYSDIECTNNLIVLTEYGGSMTNYKLTKI